MFYLVKKTLEVMEQEKPWEHAKAVGTKVKTIWAEVASYNKLNIAINGLPALSNFSISSENTMAYKTLLTQEFLKRGYLAGTNFFASSAHELDKFSEYSDILNEIFGVISECENGGNINQLLDGPICHSGFKRLN